MDKIDILIPVYNEEDNIISLIDSIQTQKFTHNLSINKVVVYDDASNDETLKKLNIKADKNNYFFQLEIIHGKVNRGKSFALQTLLSGTHADYSVAIDSDLILSKNSLIEDMVAPFLNDKKLGLVGGWCYFSKNQNIYAQAFSFSLLILEALYTDKPFYTCWGGLMAYRKNFVKQISLPEKLYRIDGFIYMQAKKHDWNYLFRPDIQIKDQKNFSDFTFKKYAKSNARSSSFPEAFNNSFSKDQLTKEVLLTRSNQLMAVINAFKKAPFKGVIYIALKLISYIYNIFSYKSDKVLWRD